MKTLELKIPPPIVLFVCLVLAYGLSLCLPLLAIPPILSGLFGYLIVIGVLLSLAGIWEFRKAKTTIDPTRPEKASHLVSGGIYRLTRNPMYLGMVLIIIAAVLKFGNVYGFIALPCFILYISIYQIKPEERMIENLFGQQYVQYKKKVRRRL
ncbi:MAG: isoprenylcysteine carboxylmethyltransferase family protein [Paraglaciecola sp.]|nr:isoprenylcysteine carboxylmethyltransferase family protein [Paraglaciecola sp.]